jgi:hypothetical protein
MPTVVPANAGSHAVVPAKAGTHVLQKDLQKEKWAPAFAGATDPPAADARLELK